MKLVELIVLFVSVSARTGFGPGNQEWGYVKVRPGANMFWWLYYTTADVEKYTERPIIVWLQGGPGGSSTGFGNFAELGPLDENLLTRNFTWVKNANVLFLDNPVGTGWSYVDSIWQLTTTNRQIADDLVKFFQSFFESNPEFQNVPMYIMSESYGGKMAIEAALMLHREIRNGNLKSNFKGVGLGNSWISPISSVMTWADFLLNTGVVDQEGYEKIVLSAKKTKTAVDQSTFEKATSEWLSTENIISEVSHGVDFYNILEKIPTTNARSLSAIAKPSVTEIDKKIDKIMNGPVKEALNLNATWGAQSTLTFFKQAEDFMKPVTNIVELVLNQTDLKVVVFSGQLDLIVDTPGTVKWVDNLRWVGSKKWQTTPREALSVNGLNEGYVKTLENLSMYWVNRAGHMVPRDNPLAMEKILKDLTNDFSGNLNMV